MSIAWRMRHVQRLCHARSAFITSVAALLLLLSCIPAIALSASSDCIFANGVDAPSFGLTSNSCLVITSIAPSAGGIGSSVLITGNGFDTTPGAITASFNGVPAQVGVTSTQLVVIVPQGAASGPLVIAMGGQVATAQFAIALNAVTVDITSTSSQPAIPGKFVDGPSVLGEPYPVTILMSSPSLIPPTGTIDIGDGIQKCTVVLPEKRCNLTGSVVGTVSITAVYSGDNYSSVATSKAVAHRVVANAASVAISVTPEPSLRNRSYTVTAVVSSAASANADPTGTIAVSDGTNSCLIYLPGTYIPSDGIQRLAQLKGRSINVTGATNDCDIYNFSVVGNVTITAFYSGDSNYESAVSVPISHQFVDTPAISIIQVTPEPSAPGQPYSVQARVAPVPPSTLPAAGTVTITELSSRANSCSYILPVDHCTMTATATGTLLLSASYSGDMNYGSARSPDWKHAVMVSTSTEITHVTPEPSMANQAYQVSALVTPASTSDTAPTGTVTISDGVYRECTFSLPETGCRIHGDSAQTVQLTASYSGDTTFSESTSRAISHTISAIVAPTITSVDPNSGAIGKEVRITGTNFDAISVGGNKVFFNGTRAFVASAESTLLLVTIPPGATTGRVTVTTNDLTAISPSDFVVLQPGNGIAAIVITNVNGEPSIVNQPYTVSVTVSAVSPPAPTGTLLVGNGHSGCFIDLPDTSCTMTGERSVGEVSLVAAYSGDANYQSAVSNSTEHITNPVEPTEMCGLDPWSAPNDPTGFVPLTQLSGIVYTPGLAKDITGTGPLSVQIDTPNDGAMLTSSSVDVVGTFFGPQNTGITVNGVVAHTVNGHFLASDVSLAGGSNEISVQATTLTGAKAAKAINATQAGADLSPVTLTVDGRRGASGPAPFQIDFNVEIGALPNNAPVKSIAIDADGDGIYESSATTLANLPAGFIYNLPGIYSASLKVMDNRGNEYLARRTVLIQDPVAHRYMLCDIYAYLKDRLNAQDAIGASNAHQPLTQAKYLPFYQALGFNMPASAQMLGSVANGFVGNGYAELTIVRDNTNQTRSGFPLRMTQGTDGVWRISEM